MTWMLTATGREFHLEFVHRDSIAIADIAHHLACVNRYTGAARRPLSVAEHSLFVVELLKFDGVTDPRILLLGLLHDAHEAYTNDLATPMKTMLGSPWATVEHRVQHAILAKFGLLATNAAWHDIVKHADTQALVTERHQLLPATGPRWPAQDVCEPAAWWNFDDRAGMGWQDWRRAFLDAFEELTFAGQARHA